MANYYKNNLQYILDKLQWINLLIHLHVLKQRLRDHNHRDELQGLYISEEEINTLLATLAEKTPYIDRYKDSNSDNLQLTPVINAIQNLKREIIKKQQETYRRGILLPLFKLAKIFQLSDFELDAIFICLAPEIDLGYEKLYAYLQNDVTKKSPSVELILTLFCNSIEEKLTKRVYFSPQACLFKNQILGFFHDHQGTKTSLLSQFLKIDERIVNFLLDIDQMESRILLFTKLRKPKINFQDLIVLVVLILFVQKAPLLV